EETDQREEKEAGNEPLYFNLNPIRASSVSFGIPLKYLLFDVPLITISPPFFVIRAASGK
ncbi:hypothetical protein, partial [Neisseria gonorrhoeae]